LVNKNMTVNGNITLGGDSPTYRVKNVAIPIEDSDVATKRYVDAQIYGGGFVTVAEGDDETFTKDD